MSDINNSILLFVGTLRLLLFVAGVLVAVAAVLSWAVRTRRISPFSAVARFSRQLDRRLFAGMERRVLRAGGLPAHAPWWTLAAVVVGGLIVLSLLEFILGQVGLLLLALSGDGRVSIAAVVANWIFGYLQLAIMVRVIASWVGGGPYSKWWRWAYVSTEWFMEPLRRVLPTLGPIDISPLVAYFALYLLKGAVVGMLL